jgi:hypothetical protein
LSARRPCCAAQVFFATTAMPSGTATTSVTPLTLRAALASNDTIFAPNDGGNAMTAVSRPGSFTSPVYCAVPLHLDGESTRGVACSRPISENWSGVLSTGFFGASCFAAAAAISP